MQVEQDVQLVQQLRQQVENQAAMLHGWGYSQLPGILQQMNVWKGVFGRAGGPYSSRTPGTSLDQQYQLGPGSYANTSDADIESKRDGWDREERKVLVENRTVQDDTYQSLQPTADRINQYVQRSNAATGGTAALQAGNEELATLVAQLQTMQAQELTDARGEVERDARRQAEDAYTHQQRTAVRAGWNAPQAPTKPLADAFPTAAE